MSLFEVFTVMVMTVLITLIVIGVFSSKPVGFMWHWAIAFFSGLLLACFVASVSFQERLLAYNALIDEAVQQVIQTCEPHDQPPDSRSLPEPVTASPVAGSGGETG